MQLQTEETLVWSTVVANCRMNRERGLRGVNSYEKELKLDILSLLEEKAQQGEMVRWLDICCGTAKALGEAASFLQKKGITNVKIEGWDVAGLFINQYANLSNLHLVAGTIAHWQPTYSYDLITCVHGLHYIGDKVSLIEKCLSALTPEGIFVSNLDLKNIKKLDGISLDRRLKKVFRSVGLHYNSRLHLLTCRGQKQMKAGLLYVGANDQAGKNYTGQEAVDSYYEFSQGG
jgi:SAM-dependent methyltransferase